jgi:hypothetical protein
MNALRRDTIAAALCLAVSTGALAQTTANAPEADRLQQLENRLNQMDAHYQEELKKRDAQISELRHQLQEARQGPSQIDIDRANATKKITDDILADIEQRKKDEPLQRIAAIANPDIAVVADFLGVASSKNTDATRNRFDVREAELDLRASVDPRADAVLVLAFARDATPELFDKSEIDDVDTSVELEEGYLFLHDFGVPNLTARVGRYHVRFGRQNVLHLHDLPTSDTPFVLQSFLAPEALTDAGIETSWLVPNPLNEYIELVTEFNSGEGSASESPTLRGGAKAQSPSIVNHLLWNKNLTDNINLELGGSVLWGPSTDRDTPGGTGQSRDVWLYGTDATLVCRDPTGGFNNQLFQAEAIFGNTRQDNGTMANAWGAYLLAQQQLNKDWYAGLRLDYTQDANDNHRDIWGGSAYLSWYLSEFLRFRVEYQYRAPSSLPDENLLFFQITWIYGAHPPHPYWSMR